MNASEIIRVMQDSETFRLRCEYALIKAALAVMAEGAGVDNHATRVEYAKQVLAGEAHLRQVVIAVLTNSTITGAASENAVTQADIEFQVNSVFNALAGVG